MFSDKKSLRIKCFFGCHEKQYLDDKRCVELHAMTGLFRPWECKHCNYKSWIVTIPEMPVTKINNRSEIKIVTEITVTQDQLADAFTEWDRRYREEPERFKSEAEHLLKETPHQYGQACAPYLIKIIHEQNLPLPVIPQPQ